jgi:hypothetical protein
MFTLGMRVATRSGKRCVRLVILDSDGSVPPYTAEHVCDSSASIAARAKELQHWTSSVLSSQPPLARAVLFEADRAPGHAADTDAGRERQRLEGAMLVSVAELITNVDVRNGKALGDLLGCTKAVAISRGAALGLPMDFSEAAAAALAAAA